MTPKEKAVKFIDKFMFASIYFSDGEEGALKNAKQCALIAVDEIIEQWDYIDTYLADLRGELNPNLRYWQEVKREINDLEHLQKQQCDHDYSNGTGTGYYVCRKCGDIF